MIDVTFRFTSDTPEGKDPDSHSPTLRQYHGLLWSKQLPNGKYFELSDTTPGAYLHHRSELGEFRLSSDAISSTYMYVKSRAAVCPIKHELLSLLFLVHLCLHDIKIVLSR